ncbi:unnamed protein product [Effrenium voratum]|nr:unnamed protein product [Effrenium voratum]
MYVGFAGGLGARAGAAGAPVPLRFQAAYTQCSGPLVAATSITWVAVNRWKRRIPRRSRGGEADGPRKSQSASQEEDPDFFSGFRAALGSKEAQLTQELQAARRAAEAAEGRASKVEGEKQKLWKEVVEAQVRRGYVGFGQVGAEGPELPARDRADDGS